MQSSQKSYIYLLLLMVSSTIHCEDNSSTENNEIIPKESIKNIDDNVRQALLRAIDKLEKQAAENYSNDEDFSENNDEDVELKRNVTELHTTSNSADEILEESTKPDVAPNVQFFTASFDEKLSKELPLLSIIGTEKQPSKKANPLLNLSSSDNLNVTPFVEIDNRQDTHSIISDLTNEISSESKSDVQFQITKAKKKYVPMATTTPTITTTTTTTTPRPTHNDDGENIELVNKDDIKIQAAPLVTAFTVDLDEQGGAKNVISILDRPATANKPEELQSATGVGPTIARLNVLSSGFLMPTPLPSEKVPEQYRTNGGLLGQTVLPTVTSGIPVSNSLRNDLVLQQQHQLQLQQHSEFPLVNNYLIERQRTLEQQIYQLQLQAKQQQEQIARQLQILEQQNHQRQQQQQLPQQSILPPLATSTTQKSSDPTSGYTIRPSIEFIPAPKPSENFGFSSNQQLPINEATKFNDHSNNNNLFNSNDLFTSKGNTNAFGSNNNGNLLFTQNSNSNIFGLNGPQRIQQHQQQTSVQIQPSNQLNFVPNLFQSLIALPAELSPYQNLPRTNYQTFQDLPFLSGNNNLLQQQHQQQFLLQQQQQEQQQQHQRSRQFRHESGTGNFGSNQLTANQNQNFYRQQLTVPNTNQLQNGAAGYQSAMNHGINPYAPPNLRYQPGQAVF